MSEQILWGLGEWALRATALAAVVGLLLCALRIKDVSFRLAAWTAVLLGVLLLPIAALVVPRLSISVLKPAVRIEIGTPATGSPPTPIAQNPSASQNTQVMHNTPAESLNPPKLAVTEQAPLQKTIRSQMQHWPVLVVGLWLLVAAAMLFRLLLGLWLSQRLVRTSSKIQEGIRESSSLTVPVTVGLLRPVILLPPDWRDWEEWKLQAVLAHEQAHVLRHDTLRQVTASVYRSVCWFHPLAWWLCAKLAEFAEAASDDAALRAAPDHVRYAEILLGFLERASRRVQWEGIPMAKKETAAKRIDRILDSQRRLSGSLKRGVVLALAVVAAPLIYSAASLRPVWADIQQSPASVVSATPAHPVTVPAGSMDQKQPGLKPPGLLHSEEASGSQSVNKLDGRIIPAQKSELAQKHNTEKPNQDRSTSDRPGSDRSNSDAATAMQDAPLLSLSAPIQILPANATAWSEHTYPRTIKFQWLEVPGATSYGIEINCFLCCAQNQWCSDVGMPTHIVRGLAEPTYTLDNFVGSQPGSWRVWAINDKFEDGPASPWWEFTFSAANSVMRFPLLPSNNTPPVRYGGWVSPRGTRAQTVVPASKDGVLGSNGVSPVASAATLPSAPIYSPGQLSSPIKAIYSPDPSYTDAARKAKITGEVMLRVVVGADGLVKQASVTRSLTPGLDESALNTVKTWRFEPARRDGVAVSFATSIGISFHAY